MTEAGNRGEGGVLAEVRAAADGASDWLGVRQRLQERAAAGEEEVYRPFVFAFGYMLIDSGQIDKRERAGGPFGAMIAGEDWRFPPALDEVEDADVEAWSEAADAIEDPVAASRLNDLLWELRAGENPAARARTAARAYVALSHNDAWHVMERTRCLTRALELARMVNDTDLALEAIERAVELSREVLAAEERGPGAVLVIARALMNLPEQQRPAELPELLEACRQRFGDDPFIAESVTDVEARLADPDRQVDLRRAQVQRWREAAKQGDALLRLIHLEKALEVARTHGLAAEADDIRRELQGISPDSLDLKSISAEVSIPTEDVEAFFASIVEQEDWRESLRHFGSEGPPGGSQEDLEEQLAEEREQFVFSRLLTRTVMGSESAASRFRADDDASRDRLERAERRQWYARMMASFYAETLDRIAKKHGVPPRDELAAFFTTDLIAEERAERVARSFELYWDGQWDESAHVLVPRLEAVCRDLAREAGLVIIRDPRGATPGGVRAVGPLLRDLAGAFPDAGWHDYIYNVLGDPLGLNLRNNIAHGLVATVERGDAALLLHIACFLRLLGVASAPSRPAADSA